MSDKVREESKKITNGCGFYSHHAAPWTKDLLCWVKGVASLLWKFPVRVASNPTFLRCIAAVWHCTVALPPLRHRAGIHPSIPCSRPGALFWNLLCRRLSVSIDRLHGIDLAGEEIEEWGVIGKLDDRVLNDERIGRSIDEELRHISLNRMPWKLALVGPMMPSRWQSLVQSGKCRLCVHILASLDRRRPAHAPARIQ